MRISARRLGAIRRWARVDAHLRKGATEAARAGNRIAPETVRVSVGMLTLPKDIGERFRLELKKQQVIREALSNYYLKTEVYVVWGMYTYESDVGGAIILGVFREEEKANAWLETVKRKDAYEYGVSTYELDEEISHE